IQEETLQACVNLRGTLPRTPFAPTGTSILARFPSPCNSRIGASGCHAYIPRMHGDQPSHRANSQHCTVETRRQGTREELARTSRCAHFWQQLSVRITRFAPLFPPSLSGLKPDAPSSNVFREEKRNGRRR